MPGVFRLPGFIHPKLNPGNMLRTRSHEKLAMLRRPTSPGICVPFAGVSSHTEPIPSGGRGRCIPACGAASDFFMLVLSIHIPSAIHCGDSFHNSKFSCLVVLFPMSGPTKSPAAGLRPSHSLGVPAAAVATAGRFCFLHKLKVARTPERWTTPFRGRVFLRFFCSAVGGVNKIQTDAACPLNSLFCVKLRHEFSRISASVFSATTPTRKVGRSIKSKRHPFISKCYTPLRRTIRCGGGSGHRKTTFTGAAVHEIRTEYSRFVGGVTNAAPVFLLPLHGVSALSPQRTVYSGSSLAVTHHTWVAHETSTPVAASLSEKLCHSSKVWVSKLDLTSGSAAASHSAARLRLAHPLTSACRRKDFINVSSFPTPERWFHATVVPWSVFSCKSTYL